MPEPDDRPPIPIELWSSPAKRRQRAEELRALGFSYRAVASELGISHEHVRRILGVTVTPEVTPGPVKPPPSSQAL